MLLAAPPGGATTAATTGTAPARATTGATGPGVPGATAAGTPDGVTTVPDGTDGKVAGMAIPNVDPQQSDAEVQRLHNTDGINTISLFVWWWMPQADSNFVERCTNTTQGDQQNCFPTEPDAELQVQIAAARQNGMRVILVPIFYCGTCEGGWRGTAQPADVNAWFNSYRQFIDHYADLAQQNGVTTLFVGSEMDSLENQTSQWQQVISEARQHYSGQIGYEQNWDVLGTAHFLGGVDMVGISAYFPLDDGKSPSLGSLLTDWSNSHASAYQARNWLATLNAFARSTGKPILFGEVGYMSGDYAAKQPFLNYQSTINWQLQSDLYQAVLQTFENQTWWAGAVWWEWYIPPNSNTDDGHTPRGKTAETLLQHWYRDGWRPVVPNTPLALSDAAHSPDNPELNTGPATSSPGGHPASSGTGSAASPAGAPGTHSAAAARGAGATTAARAGTGRAATSSRNAPGTQAGSAPGSAAGAQGVTAGGSAAPLHSKGREVGLVIAAALAVIVLALLLYNAVRLAESRRHPRSTPSTRLG